MVKSKIFVTIDEKNSFWIIVENDKIISKNPIREELMKVSKILYYNKTNICHICREENNITDKSILYPRNARRETDKEGNKTDEWVCHRHGVDSYQRYDSNSTNNAKKSLANCRTGNQDPNHNNTIGDNYQELACMEFGWEDLNKKNDNNRSPVDCYDHKTGLFHQIRGRRYNIENGYWNFGPLEHDWHKEYESAVLYCASEDGELIGRMYIIPSWEIKKRKSIGICKNPMNTRGTSPIIPWYERYRIKDPEELRKTNEILSRKLETK